jgi:hypothetical protein
LYGTDQETRKGGKEEKRKGKARERNEEIGRDQRSGMSMNTLCPCWLIYTYLIGRTDLYRYDA